jgi:2'-5' RNA ligase
MPPRCFIALTLPDALLGTLGSAREAFIANAPGWAGEKWVATGNLHVTVAFLGALDDGQLESRVACMRDATACVPAFEMRPTGVAAVPSRRRATMLWATLLDPTGSLTVLLDALLTAFPAQDSDQGKQLRPHVTLARARSPRRAGREALAAASSVLAAAGKEPEGIVSVSSATLFSSTLLPEGPQYREIAVARLAL